MPGGVRVVWNDTRLKAGVQMGFDAALRRSHELAAAKCQWRHVRASIVSKAVGKTGAVGALAPDAKWLEFGTHAHTEAPRIKQAMKFPDGGFARGTIQHPAVAAHPFLRPVADAWPLIVKAELRAHL
jgi:hypothetical protein